MTALLFRILGTADYALPSWSSCLPYCIKYLFISLLYLLLSSKSQNYIIGKNTNLIKFCGLGNCFSKQLYFNIKSVV